MRITPAQVKEAAERIGMQWRPTRCHRCPGYPTAISDVFVQCHECWVHDTRRISEQGSHDGRAVAAEIFGGVMDRILKQSISDATSDFTTNHGEKFWSAFCDRHEVNREDDDLKQYYLCGLHTGFHAALTLIGNKTEKTP